MNTGVWTVAFGINHEGTVLAKDFERAYEVAKQYIAKLVEEKEFDNNEVNTRISGIWLNSRAFVPELDKKQ